MKLPVLEKAYKITYVLLSVVIFLLALMMCIILIAADVYQEGGPVAFVLVASLAIFFLVCAFFLIVTTFSYVILDEAGVTLYFGKLKLNKIEWSDVKRVELIFVGSNIWILNIMTIDEPSFSFRRARMLENTNRKRITFIYEKDAMDLIRQHYDGEIVTPKPL